MPWLTRLESSPLPSQERAKWSPWDPSEVRSLCAWMLASYCLTACWLPWYVVEEYYIVVDGRSPPLMIPVKTIVPCRNQEKMKMSWRKFSNELRSRILLFYSLHFAVYFWCLYISNQLVYCSQLFILLLVNCLSLSRLEMFLKTRQRYLDITICSERT